MMTHELSGTEQLLQDVETFLNAYAPFGMTATRLGREACDDQAAIFRLRQGARPSHDRAVQLYRYMDTYAAHFRERPDGS